MRYHSHKTPSVKAAFSDALLASLAPDGGLWMPDRLPYFPAAERAELARMSFAALASRLAREFVDDRFSQADIDGVCVDAYDIDLPIRTLRGASHRACGKDYMLELFHGPTLAFKDFAARFMARATAKLLGQSGMRRTILVATSGDTGGAVGAAFAGLLGVRVCILYPKDGVSRIQRAQLNMVGREEGNVRALAVEGSFDDCQALVKAAFADDELAQAHGLMSANSINIGRVIPQSFYYYWSSLKLKAIHPDEPLMVSVPSGNLGNLTGGLIARKMGAPIDRFIVAHNVNDPFVEYLTTSVYRPRASVRTLSNAMDVGRPNNIARILALFDNDVEAIREVCWGASFTDTETEAHLRAVHDATGYLMCPHTAVGYAAAQAYKEKIDDRGVFLMLATAHPAKFAEAVERIAATPVDLPPSLAAALAAQPKVTTIEPSLPALRTFLDAERDLVSGSALRRSGIKADTGQK